MKKITLLLLLIIITLSLISQSRINQSPNAPRNLATIDKYVLTIGKVETAINDKDSDYLEALCHEKANDAYSILNGFITQGYSCYISDHNEIEYDQFNEPFVKVNLIIHGTSHYESGTYLFKFSDDGKYLITSVADAN